MQLTLLDATTLLSFQITIMYERLYTTMCGGVAVDGLKISPQRHFDSPFSLASMSPSGSEAKRHTHQQDDDDFSSRVPHNTDCTVADMGESVGTVPLATRDENFYSIYLNPELVAKFSTPRARLHIYDRGLKGVQGLRMHVRFSSISLGLGCV